MVPTNVLHAVAGRLHQFLFCSFPEYSAGYNSAQHLVGADVHIGPFVRFHRTASFAATPPPCLRRLVLTNSTSLAPPQAAGLVRSVARPLQIANASLVCNLVPSVLPEKVGKKMRWKTIYGAYAQILFSALTGAELQPFRWLSVRINVLHAVIDRLNQFQFCSFPEYPTGGPM